MHDIFLFKIIATSFRLYAGSIARAIVIHKLLLGHLPISIIDKGLLELVRIGLGSPGPRAQLRHGAATKRRPRARARWLVGGWVLAPQRKKKHVAATAAAHAVFLRTSTTPQPPPARARGGFRLRRPCPCGGGRCSCRESDANASRSQSGRQPPRHASRPRALGPAPGRCRARTPRLSPVAAITLFRRPSRAALPTRTRRLESGPRTTRGILIPPERGRGAPELAGAATPRFIGFDHWERGAGSGGRQTSSLARERDEQATVAGAKFLPSCVGAHLCGTRNLWVQKGRKENWLRRCTNKSLRADYLHRVNIWIGELGATN